MSDLKFSVVIPYPQRPEAIRSVFAALADQTMDSAEFEVIVGEAEQSDELATACRDFTDRLTIKSVRSDPGGNDADEIADDEALVLFDCGSALEVLPAIAELSDRYRDAVVREAQRVATRVVTPRPDGG